MNRSTLLSWILLPVLSGLGLTACFSSPPADATDIAVQFVPQQVAAQNGAVIRIQPASQQLNVGDETTLEIQIDNATSLTAADVQLQFNPGILQAQDADSGKEGVQLQPGTFPAPDFVAINVITNTTGIIQYTLVQLPPTEPVSGSGLLASITVQAVASGSSDFAFLTTNLVDADGQLSPVTAQSGQIIVGPITASPTITTVPATATLPVTSTPTDQPTGTVTPTAIILTPTLPPSTPTATLPPAPSPTSLPVPPPSPTSTPIPPVTHIPPGATKGFCYRVQEGDTLYSLGQRFGMDPHFINLVNDLHPPGHIFFYQVLFIPQQYGNGPNIYIKEPGDTLTTIAESCGLPVSFLAWVNHLDENAVLADGHVLIIPIPPFPPPSRFPYPPLVFPFPYN